MKTAGKFLSAILTIVLSTLATLYLVEGYLRLFYHPVALIAPYYPWSESAAGGRIRAIQREYDIEMAFSRQGFRDREFTPDKGTRKRILCLGDSFVEAMGVPVEKRTSNLLEKMLNEKRASGGASPGYEVLNAAQGATDPIVYFNNLIGFGLALRPDMVVVGVFIGNDFQNGRLYPLPSDYRVVDAPHLFETRPSSFAAFGYLRQLVKQTVTHKTTIVRNIRTDKLWDFFLRRRISLNWFYKVSGLSRADFDKKINMLPKDVVDDFSTGRLNPAYLLESLQAKAVDSNKQYYTPADLENVYQVIKEMHTLCADRHIPFIVIIYPHSYQVMKKRYREFLFNDLGMTAVPHQLLELDSMQNRFMSLLRHDKVQFIDLKNVLSERDYFLFDGHLNERGNAAVADTLFPRVVSVFREQDALGSDIR